MLPLYVHDFDLYHDRPVRLKLNGVWRTVYQYTFSSEHYEIFLEIETTLTGYTGQGEFCGYDVYFDYDKEDNSNYWGLRCPDMYFYAEFSVSSDYPAAMEQFLINATLALEEKRKFLEKEEQK